MYDQWSPLDGPSPDTEEQARQAIILAASAVDHALGLAAGLPAEERTMATRMLEGARSRMVAACGAVADADLVPF